MPLNVLQQSPHDLLPQEPAGDLSAPVLTTRWVASRYTVRATTDDGRLVLWNTASSAMNVFSPSKAIEVKNLLKRSGIEVQGEVPQGNVEYLARRGYLVREGTNELRRVQMQFGRDHYRTDLLELILLASEDCNFRCSYCYEDFARGTMQPWVRTAIRRNVEKRLGTLKRLKVSWFGGEPLYGMAAIEDLGPFFVDAARRQGIPFVSGMTTNGYLLTPEVADKLLAWQINAFQITIDGPAKYHDCSRPARDGQGTFTTIFENLKALHRRPDPFRVTVRVNFDQRNHPEMGEFLDLVAGELSSDPRFKLMFRAVGRWGGPNDAQLDVCGVEEAEEVKQSLETEARLRGINIGTGLREYAGSGSAVCYAARPFNLLVGASGKLMKCTVALDKDPNNVVGRLTEEGEAILDDDKMALWTEPAFESDGKCKKCVVLPICHGIHCPLIRMEEQRSPCMPVRLHLKPALLATQALAEDAVKQRRTTTAAVLA